jgi:hypothetical protein
MSKERIKKTVTARIEGTRKRGRPRNKRTDEFEEDLKIMVRRNWRAVVRDGKEWRTIVLKAGVRYGL